MWEYPYIGVPPYRVTPLLVPLYKVIPYTGTQPPSFDREALQAFLKGSVRGRIWTLCIDQKILHSLSILQGARIPRLIPHPGGDALWTPQIYPGGRCSLDTPLRGVTAPRALAPSGRAAARRSWAGAGALSPSSHPRLHLLPDDF